MKDLKISSTEICESFKAGENLVREVTKSIDMGVLLEKTNRIQQEVKELQNIIKMNKAILEKYPAGLKKLSETYKDTRMEIISLNLGEVFLLIRDNLPIGVYGKIDDASECLILTREEKAINNKKSKVDPKDIGKVIRVDSEENKFKVILNGENIKEYEETFELDSLSRIYKIVASININMAYKE